MVTMVDPPGGWAYGFPAPLQGDYEKQLRDAGYPERDIPLALEHSWSWVDNEEAPLKTGLATAPEQSAAKTLAWIINPVYTGVAPDGDDGA